MNAVFIHIPKTGGLTVQNTLQFPPLRNRHRIKNNFRDRGPISVGHMLYPKLIRHGLISREFDRSAFKACFCRNPYDRAVSHWSYTMRKHPDRLAPGTSFLEFTRLLPEKPDFRPQSWWVEGVEIDFLGRFERLEKDILRLADHLGVRVGAIPKSNSSYHPPYPYCYCEESKQRVEDFYKPDFERFGYEHDDTILH